MNTNRRFKKMARAIAAFSFSGVLFSSSCGSQELRNLADELDSFAVQIDEAEEVSFRDFLLSQFKD